MSRHTLNDGITPDPRILRELYDEHLVILAPSPRLMGDYYKRDLQWAGFEVRYLQQIHQPDIIPVVRRLARRATEQTITLCCIEETAEFCHRRLLAEECVRYEPSLNIVHR
jgi:uncharacterized protein YeaO (DUF488 family)